MIFAYDLGALDQRLRRRVPQIKAAVRKAKEQLECPPGFQLFNSPCQARNALLGERRPCAGFQFVCATRIIKRRMIRGTVRSRFDIQTVPPTRRAAPPAAPPPEVTPMVAPPAAAPVAPTAPPAGVAPALFPGAAATVIRPEIPPPSPARPPAMAPMFFPTAAARPELPPAEEEVPPEGAAPMAPTPAAPVQAGVGLGAGGLLTLGGAALFLWWMFTRRQ